MPYEQMNVVVSFCRNTIHLRDQQYDPPLKSNIASYSVYSDLTGLDQAKQHLVQLNTKLILQA